MKLDILTEEVSQVVNTYCDKFNITSNNEWYLLKIQEELGELVQSYLELNNKSRKRDTTNEELKQNFENEVADLFCIVLAMSKHNEINLERVINDKWLKWIKKQ